MLQQHQAEGTNSEQGDLDQEVLLDVEHQARFFFHEETSLWLSPGNLIFYISLINKLTSLLIKQIKKNIT